MTSPVLGQQPWGRGEKAKTSPARWVHGVPLPAFLFQGRLRRKAQGSGSLRANQRLEKLEGTELTKGVLENLLPKSQVESTSLPTHPQALPSQTTSAESSRKDEKKQIQGQERHSLDLQVRRAVHSHPGGPPPPFQLQTAACDISMPLEEGEEGAKEAAGEP